MGRVATFVLLIIGIFVFFLERQPDLNKEELEVAPTGVPLKALFELSDDELTKVGFRADDIKGEQSKPVEQEEDVRNLSSPEPSSEIVEEVIEDTEVTQVVVLLSDAEIEQSEPDEVVSKCLLIGELRELSDIQKIERFVAARGAAVERVTRIKEELGPYTVFIPPQKTANDAINIVEELRDRNVDSIIIRDPPNENGVSLGVFRSDENSAALASRIRGMGYDVKRRRMSIERKLYSVHVSGPEVARIENDFWDEITQNYSEILVEEKSCEEVASVSNFQ